MVFVLIVPSLGDSHLVTPSLCSSFFLISFLSFFSLLHVLFDYFVLFQHIVVSLIYFSYLSKKKYYLGKLSSIINILECWRQKVGLSAVEKA